MAPATLEDRLAALEAQMNALVAASRLQPGTHDWRATIGAFTGDSEMRRIQQNAMEYRELDRKAARTDPNYFDDIAE